MVQDVEETENLFRQQSGQVKGRVKVDVPGRVGSRIVIPALPDFLPATRRFRWISASPIAASISRRKGDCAVRVGALNDSGMVARRVGELKLINVASEGYISSFGSPVSPERLAGHIAVGYVSPTSGRQARWEWVLEGRYSAPTSAAT